MYECIRRLMQTGLNVFIFPGTDIGIAVNIFLSFVFIKVHTYFQPYIDDDEDFLSELSHCAEKSLPQSLIARVSSATLLDASTHEHRRGQARTTPTPLCHFFTTASPCLCYSAIQSGMDAHAA